MAAKSVGLVVNFVDLMGDSANMDVMSVDGVGISVVGIGNCRMSNG